MQAISLVQRGNLQALEKTLRKQWRLGQNIVLCWCSDERGLLVIFVPHYFLGNYSAEVAANEGDENEAYIRRLISGGRRKSRDELFRVAARLRASPTFIKLEYPLDDSRAVDAAVEQIIRRYGLSYVDSRAVLLFDISDFSLHTPFEQASQLNSLSYSMNSAYNKLLSRGIDVQFARTTTGDGYYVWNRSSHASSDRDLFLFFLLVLADNALARSVARGNTVPRIRSAVAVGSHYELYQAEGVNPTVFSYIVGDVTIELARLLERSKPSQILMGERAALALSDSAGDPAAVSCEGCGHLVGVSLMSRPIAAAQCRLTGPAGEAAEVQEIRDKHGLTHRAFNLQVELALSDGQGVTLGLSHDELVPH